MESILVPIAFFAMIAIIVGVSVWGSVQGKRAIADTIRRSIEAGHPVDPETISAITRPSRSRDQDLRGGIVMIALSIGFVIAGFMLQGGIPDAEGAYWSGNGLFIAAAIVGSIGIGQLVAALVTRRKDAA